MAGILVIRPLVPVFVPVYLRCTSCTVSVHGIVIGISIYEGFYFYPYNKSKHTLGGNPTMTTGHRELSRESVGLGQGTG